jgi:hypothetical protein
MRPHDVLGVDETAKLSEVCRSSTLRGVNVLCHKELRLFKVHRHAQRHNFLGSWGKLLRSRSVYATHLHALLHLRTFMEQMRISIILSMDPHVGEGSIQAFEPRTSS